MLTFAHSWLFLLLPLPLLVRWLLPPFQTARPAVRLPFFAQVAELTGGRPEAGAAIQRRSAVQGIGYVVIWCALIAALARPQWLEPPIVRVVPTRDLLLAVDLSGSMAEEDFTGKDGQKVDRLSAAKEVLDEFLTRRKGDRVGLVVFGNAAFVQVPFTEDLDVCRQLLAETVPRMAGPKTAFGDAIGLGITLFERSAVKRRVMIALTDGNDTGSQVPPAEAARIAKDKGIVIHTVAMGDPTTVGEDKLDEEALRAVTQATGGQYFFAADRASLEGIYGTLDQVETRQVETISHRPRRDLFHWPLGFATVVALTYPLVSSALGTVRGRRLERRSSNQSESRYGQTPSPSTEEGRGGGEARRGSRSPSLPLPPHPNLGAIASAQGRQAFSPPGGEGAILHQRIGATTPREAAV